MGISSLICIWAQILIETLRGMQIPISGGASPKKGVHFYIPGGAAPTFYIDVDVN